ncbi:MAG: hypothetical protein Ct9H300mP15_27280 [Gemmatimonadota bacterium]|nr:MAG: hypothetical protein Ct9H300mP15_27280 [Gemmatimonadota bacterium]
MVEGTSFMGFGDPDLAKKIPGEILDTEELGGARATQKSVLWRIT